jgi:hypothetical protein
MGEAVAARPIRAVRAGVAFGVVDTFLVRAADDAVGHDHGASLMLAKEGLDLLADNRIGVHRCLRRTSVRARRAVCVRRG